MSSSGKQAEDKGKQHELLDLLHSKHDELKLRLDQLFRSTAFDNRFTLHPRRLAELGGELLHEFESYLAKQDSGTVAEAGRAKAHEGLNLQTLMSGGHLLREFWMEQLGKSNPEALQQVLSSSDAFMSLYLEGYIQAREEEVLKDQEQLRVALSTALDRQSRELLIKNHAIHTATYGIILWDLEGRITYANPAALGMLSASDPQKMLEEARNWISGGDTRAMIADLQKRGSWHGENAVQLADGRSLDLEIYASLIRDERDQPVGYISSFYDITERKRLEGQFRQAQKMEALGQLAGGIVHDFNNLLTAISGYAQLALMELPEGTKYHQDFQQIKKATDRGKELTEELRIFTRQSAGIREPVDLNAIVEDTTKILARTFPPELRISLELDPQLKGILGQTSQMSQMVMNLCVNARDAILGALKTKEGHGTTRKSQGLLTLRTSNQILDAAAASRYLNAKPGRYVCLTVRDNGVGIPAAHLDRVFEPFFTTKGEKSGTGLGLAVVYGIVQNHGGFIELQSREKEGSTFWVFLPAQQELGRERRPADPNTDLAAGRGTILVADDDPQVREMISETLTKSGYAVLLACDGVETLSQYQNSPQPVDLVILDLVMPRMSGRECYFRLKGMNPKVKILIMTGFTADASVEDFRREGASGVITKPFGLREFTETIQRIVQKK